MSERRPLEDAPATPRAQMEEIMAAVEAAIPGHIRMTHDDTVYSCGLMARKPDGATLSVRWNLWAEVQHHNNFLVGEFDARLSAFETIVRLIAFCRGELN